MVARSHMECSLYIENFIFIMYSDKLRMAVLARASEVPTRGGGGWNTFKS